VNRVFQTAGRSKAQFKVPPHATPGRVSTLRVASAPAIIDGSYLTGYRFYVVGPLGGALSAVALWAVVPRTTLTAKLFHDPRYRSVLRIGPPRLPLTERSEQPLMMRRATGAATTARLWSEPKVVRCRCRSSRSSRRSSCLVS
jgi:hypothetical protein